MSSRPAAADPSVRERPPNPFRRSAGGGRVLGVLMLALFLSPPPCGLGGIDLVA